MKAGAIAEKAATLVSGDRKAAYGDVVRGLEKIAAMWNGTLAAAGITVSRPVTGHDVANMMEALKIARRYTGPHRIDNYIDGAGWAAVAGEVASRDWATE